MNKTIVFDYTKTGNPLFRPFFIHAQQGLAKYDLVLRLSEREKELNFVPVNVDHTLYCDENMIDRKRSLC